MHSGDMLGHVSYVRIDLERGLGVVACANGFAGAWWLGEGALAICAGASPPTPELESAEPLVGDGSGSEELRRCVGRYRAHS